MGVVRRPALRGMLMLLTGVLLLAGIGVATPQTAMAAPGDWHTLRFNGNPVAKGQCGFVNANRQAQSQPTKELFGNYNFFCALTDVRADRYAPFIVARVWDGAAWKVVPGFGNRLCTNNSGAGSTLTCTKTISLLQGQPVSFRITIGIVNRFTGATVKTTVWSDDWLAPV